MKCLTSGFKDFVAKIRFKIQIPSGLEWAYLDVNWNPSESVFWTEAQHWVQVVKMFDTQANLIKSIHCALVQKICIGRQRRNKIYTHTRYSWTISKMKTVLKWIIFAWICFRRVGTRHKINTVIGKRGLGNMKVKMANFEWRLTDNLVRFPEAILRYGSTILLTNCGVIRFNPASQDGTVKGGWTRLQWPGCPQLKQLPPELGPLPPPPNPPPPPKPPFPPPNPLSGHSRAKWPTPLQR